MAEGFDIYSKTVHFEEVCLNVDSGYLLKSRTHDVASKRFLAFRYGLDL